MGCFCAILLGIGCFSSARAAPVILAFDELSYQPVNGLNYMGIDFGFTAGDLDSDDAHHNSLGPGTLTYVQGAVLEGDVPGVLILYFGYPSSILQFGVAVQTFDELSPGFSVDLFDPALASLGSFPVNTSPLITFSEGQFVYSGPSLIRRAVIHFDSSADRFAFDNLTYNAVSEPTTVSPVLLGLAAMLAVRRQRRRSRVGSAVRGLRNRFRICESSSIMSGATVAERWMPG